MKTVYKYDWDDTFDSGDTIHYKFIVPPSAVIRQIAIQDSCLRLWAEVDSSESCTRSISVYVVPTGGNVPEGVPFFTTLFEGPYVWHIYISGGEN